MPLSAPTPSSTPTPSLGRWRLRLFSAVSVALVCLGAIAGEAVATGAQTGAPAAPVQQPSASAAVEQCVQGAAQSERSATFAAEMTAMPGSVRMAIRIEIQEQLAGEALFHTVTASGLSASRVSDPGVKAYRYNKQVTNLFAPAAYRAIVRFRWLNAKGRLMRSAVRRTPRCRQPAAAPYAPGASTEVSGSIARMVLR
jgi:hypothetical protein